MALQSARATPLKDSSLGAGSALHPSELVVEAMERFERCSKHESTARQRFIDDYKFANADAYNGYQWPNNLRQAREIDKRPCLTLNGVRQHNLQIINDAKQNKPGVKILATGGGASAESAQVLQALVRHIEYTSNATSAYDRAVTFMTTAGWGYLRVETDYENEDNFDQAIFIRGIADPLSVYLDPDAKEPDKSDAKFAFIFEDIQRDEFERDARYKRYAHLATSSALGDSEGWMHEDYLRVAEYFRVVEREDTLYMLPKGYGGLSDFPGGFVKASFLKKASKRGKARETSLLRIVEADETVASRQLIEKHVEYKLIIGHQEITEEARDWPGRYIPIIPVFGEEVTIEGVWDCKSHTRAMLDPQRMYNYAASQAVEYMATQTKSPWVAPVGAIEELETYWNAANTTNASVLPYKHRDENGNEIPPPTRVPPPTNAPAYATQMQASLQDLLMVSGQYAAQMGAQGNERSAKAISERQRQADNATYGFVDALAVAIRFLGRILIDLIPKIYDTERTLQILAEDGTTMEVLIDPQAKMAHEKRQKENELAVQHIFNPSVGKYEVQAEVGPSYATKREETFNAMSLILTQSPQLTSVLGDILFRAGDFPHAEEAAQRLRRMVPSHALGEGPSAAEQALQQQIQQLQNLLSASMQELATEKIKLRGKEEKNEVAVYDAVTKRLSVLVTAAAKGEAEINEDTLRPIVEEVVRDSQEYSLQPVQNAIDERLGPSGALPSSATAPRPPYPGARLGPDGRYYGRDYSRAPGYTPLA